MVAKPAPGASWCCPHERPRRRLVLLGGLGLLLRGVLDQPLAGIAVILDPAEQDRFVQEAKRCAMAGLFTGRQDTFWLVHYCRHELIWGGSPTVAILTRDAGYHSGGWWKNPDYERCWHLSLSFAEGFTRARGDSLARLLLGEEVRFAWIEPPLDPRVGAWHYRVFCDPGWIPLKPRGEVYSRFMPAEWRSFSEQWVTD